MTVSTTTSKASASANGTQHSFAYGFKIFADADLQVTVRAADGTETLKTLNTHYIVTNAGSSSGGNVLFKFNTGTSSDAHYSSSDQRPADGETVVIKRELTLTQGTDYVANDPFPAESHEDALDRLTFISQQQQEELDRTIKASVTNTISGAEFALSATDRANKVMAFDGSGDLSVTQELGTFKGNWAASTDYVVRDIVKDSGTNNIFIVNEAHTSSGSLPLTTNTNSAKYDLIVDAASATTSQNAAAASASTASTQATNSANSATASANSATASANSATSAAASLTTFQGQYHGAASSDPSSNLDTGDLYFNTSTGIKVYTGSAWEDVKPSSSEQTNINSVASNATNINTVAGANTNITTVASNISGVTSFAERYRVASSDPSSSLDEGDLAFNTTDNNLKFYNGSAWVSIAPGIANVVEDTTPQLGGTLDVNGNTIDMNGNELILDVDADTSITADTDDQIDFKVGGSDKASLTSSGFSIDVIAEKTSASGVTIDGLLIKDREIGTSAAPATLQATSLNGAQFGRRNILHHNGAMQIAQRATSKTGINSSGYYTVDRVDLAISTTSGQFTQSQVTDAPDGFGHALKFDCTTADTSVAAGETTIVMWQVEGQDVQQMAKGTSSAKEVTVSFYAKANASKTYVCELKDFTNTRTVSKTFTVGTSYTRHEITFPADTTGAITSNNAKGFAMNIWLHAGSTYTSGSLQTTWGAQTNANRAVGIDSFYSSTDNTFFITGVQMEIGSVATEFEHRSFGECLASCQRYYRRMQRPDGSDSANTIGRGIAADRIGLAQTQSTTVANCVLDFPVAMRATPTLEVSAVADIDYAVGSSTPAATDFVITGEGANNAMLRLTESGGSLTVGQAARLQFNADDKHIAFDAEL